MRAFVLTFLLMAILAVAGGAGAQNVVDASTLDGKVLFGYQG